MAIARYVITDLKLSHKEHSNKRVAASSGTHHPASRRDHKARIAQNNHRAGPTAMKKLTTPRNYQQRLHYEPRPELQQESADRRTWTGCTGGEFSLDCPYCWHPETATRKTHLDGLY